MAFFFSSFALYFCSNWSFTKGEQLTSVTNIGTIKNIRCSARAMVLCFFSVSHLLNSLPPAMALNLSRAIRVILLSESYISGQKTCRNWATPEVHVGVAMERSSLVGGGGNLRRTQEESATLNNQCCES